MMQVDPSMRMSLEECLAEANRAQALERPATVAEVRAALAQSVAEIKAALLQAMAEQAAETREAQAQAPSPPPAPKPKDHGPHALDRKEAMALLRISCGKTFLATVRRLGIPRIKMNKRKYLYPKADLLAVLEENRVGVSRSRFARSRRQLL